MDKHIAKIILEAVQMLCTTQRLLVGADGCDPCVYKIAHKNHPVTIWCRASQANYIWTLDLIDAMHAEWKYRYGHPAHKEHKSYAVAKYLRENIPPAMVFERIKNPDILTPFALAMPDEFKIRMAAAPTGTSHDHDIYDAVASYRSYYLSAPKRRIAKWANLREMPLWYARGLRKIYGRPAPRLVVVTNINRCRYNIEKMNKERKEVQGHGFIWEHDISKIFGVTPDELNSIKYTSKMDIPSAVNHLDGCDVSIKTSHNENAVGMADCLRIYDAVTSGTPYHMVVIFYKQDDTYNIKRVVSIVEVDLTNSYELLFGKITRARLEELDKKVKSVPQKRKPTSEEYADMYSLRNKLHEETGAIHLDIKCNSQQSRLQCSFNQFQQFIRQNPSKVIAKSNTNEFRGGMITAEITSSRRIFKPKATV